MISGKFAQTGRKWAKDTKEKMRLATAEAIAMTAQAVILDSPVDTGKFVAHWKIKIGSASSEGGGYDPSRTRTYKRITSFLLEGYKIGYNVVLSNALPYAERLEYDGWSSQAPQGFLRKNLVKFPYYLALTKKKYGL